MGRYDLGGRDLNEPEFIELLRAANIEFRQLDKRAGADLLIMVNPMELWEIKNPEQPPNKRKLSENEEKTQEKCKYIGIPYFVFEHIDDALARVNYLKRDYVF